MFKVIDGSMRREAARPDGVIVLRPNDEGAMWRRKGAVEAFLAGMRSPEERRVAREYIERIASQK